MMTNIYHFWNVYHFRNLLFWPSSLYILQAYEPMPTAWAVHLLGATPPGPCEARYRSLHFLFQNVLAWPVVK
jgi:hypothetical protein